MSLPLPSNWVDTGVGFDATGSFSWSIAYGYSGSFSVGGIDIVTFTFGITGTHSSFTVATEVASTVVAGSVITVTTNVRLTKPDGTSVVLETHAFSWTFGVTSASGIFTSATYTYSYDHGSWRLGCSYGATGSSVPIYLQESGKVTYAWFADDNTVDSQSSAGYSNTYHVSPGAVSGPQFSVGIMPIALSVGVSGGSGFPATVQFLTITGWTFVGATVDTSDLHNPVLIGSGSGGVIAPFTRGVSSQNISDSAFVAPSYQATLNVNVYQDSGPGGTPGALVAGCQVNEPFLCSASINLDGAERLPYQASIANGASASILVAQRSWDEVAGHEKYKPVDNTVGLTVGPFALNGAWVAAQSPLLDQVTYDPAGDGTTLETVYDDLLMPILMPPCAQSPAYDPLIPLKWDSRFRLTVPTKIEGNRPDGNTPSTWITSDGAKLTVAEGVSSVFTVISTGAHVTRTLVANWANYIDLTLTGIGGGLSNPDESRLGLESYAITRHNDKDWQPTQHQTVYPEDVWWWNTYGYLNVHINAPAAGTLTLVVHYTTVSVDDPHITGSARVTGTTITQTPGTATYSIPVTSGANNIDVDLLFPAEDGPVSLGRITSLTLSGFAVGTYTLSSWGPAVKRDGMGAYPATAGYFKCSWGAAIHRASSPDHPLNPSRQPDWSMPVLAMNGSDAFGAIPDQAYKYDEVGSAGGGIRYVEPVTGTTSGFITDSQFGCVAFIGQLLDVEGVNAIFDQAAFDAANRDAEGNSGPTGLAQVIWPMLPYQQGVLSVPGDVYVFDPQCSSVCATVTIPAGINIYIPAVHSLFGSVCGLATLQGSGGRAPAGLPAHLKDDTTGLIIATANTDVDGFVIWTDIFANSSEQYEEVP